MVGKHILAWLVLVIVAILNGALREATYKKFVGDLLAHQLSTVSGMMLFGIVFWALSRLWPLANTRQAWIVGGAWLGMTIIFEFIFGHYVMGHPWSKLLHDYNLLQGRVWLLVLLWTAIGPYLFFKWGSKQEAC
ncbi:hypothetical protein L0128_11740 [candidate division KSB1 bacterium]|nr:hypothetical protein [candidate division KSB1 bacterium]